MHIDDQLGVLLPPLARRAIGEWLEHGRRSNVVDTQAPRAAVFVTLRTANGELRGCVGSLTARESDVFQETARSAVLAATRDPRFPSVRLEELPGLDIEVSVLSSPEDVRDPGELDPRRFGVIVEGANGRHGLLLPDIEGIDDVLMQIAVARRKAGIAPEEKVTLRRFTVTKWREQGSAA